MALTTEDMLAEAKAAYHRIVTGTAAAVIVDRNGERVEYAKTNLEALRAYIAELEVELGIEPSRKSKPLGAYF